MRLTRVLTLSALALLLLALVTPASAAGSVTSAPTADVFVSSASPTSSGNTATLQVDYPGPAGQIGDATRIAYMKFNVRNVPVGAPVTGVRVRVTGVQSQIAQVVDLHAVGDTWSETTTWDTRPALGALLASATVSSGVVTTFTLPASAVAGNGVVSFALARQTSGGQNVVASSEYTTTSSRPKLVVNYGDAPTPTPTPTATSTPTPTPEPTPTPTPTPTGLPYDNNPLIYRPLPADAPVSAANSFFQQYEAQAEPVDFWKVRGANQGIAMNYSIVHADECSDPDVKLFTILSTGNTPNQEHLKTSGFHARTSTMQAIQQNSDSPGIFVDECGTSARPNGLSVWAANLFYDGTTVLKSGGDGTITAGSFAHMTNGLDSRAPSSDAADNENIVSRGRIPESMLVTDAEVAAGLSGANNGTAGHVVEVFFVETSTAAGFQEPMVGAESGNVGCFGRTDICAEGQYVRINPSVNLAARAGCTGAALVVAKTLQLYGAYIGDNSGSGSGIKMEQLSTYASPNMLDPCMNLADLQILAKGYHP